MKMTFAVAYAKRKNQGGWTPIALLNLDGTGVPPCESVEKVTLRSRKRGVSGRGGILQDELGGEGNRWDRPIINLSKCQSGWGRGRKKR